MAIINLRPWREEQALQRKKNFATNSFIAAIVSCVIVFGIGFYFDLMKDRQKDRNNYLIAETKKLDQKIREIKELKAKRARLLERLRAIQELQGTRPLIVRNFDEIVRVLPDGVYYNSLSRKKDLVSVTGSADSSLEVSDLMRNFDRSIWFGEPNLSSVGAGQSGMKSFNLTVGVTKPEAEAKGE